jgi:HD superfamily phosphohydrolase/tRNA A-37 threonylcarbamoyl transferase component Bud32
VWAQVAVVIAVKLSYAVQGQRFEREHTTSIDDKFESELRNLYFRRDGAVADYDAEAPILLNALPEILKDLGENHELVRPLGRGGAGLVVQLRDTRLDVARALKMPRPRPGEIFESVKNEIGHLRTLRHENVISIYAAGEVSVPSFGAPYPYFVMDYIEGAKELDEFLRDRVAALANARQLTTLTNWLAATLSRVASAVRFLHEHETLHFDIKPANILVTPAGRPLLSDLGFAKKKSSDAQPVVIGFTLFYSHPELREAYEHMTDQNRVRRQRAPKDFRYAWDLYALGRTFLHLLSIIAHHVADSVMYDYIFSYLHLMACRLLDGRNLSREEVERIQQEQISRGQQMSTYFETWHNLSNTDFEQLKYDSAAAVGHDFVKLQDAYYFLPVIPEIGPHYPHRVQVSIGAPAPFSPRIKKLIEHPVFLRLRTVKQLGLADAVYPGCTHTRFEHALGTFRNCCLYIQALQNDPYNPIFRQLTNEEDLAAVLLAALLHDLGQYPLAHDLEEAAGGLTLRSGKAWKVLFRHESLSTEWLLNGTTDADGHTIETIIKNSEWRWATSVAHIAELIDDEPTDSLPLRKRDLKLRLLQSIISGALDVDKLDYLTRDSERAELPYGRMIDTERLTRSLTIVVAKDDKDRTVLTLGAYEKGQSAAEAMTFVRYQLYQALYWHHTVRAIRPMLRQVLRHLGRSTGKTKKPLDKAFRILLWVDGTPAPLTVEAVLVFFPSTRQRMVENLSP